MFAATIRKRLIEDMQSGRWRWHLDGMFMTVTDDKRQLWRAIDHQGEMLEGQVPATRDRKVALKFLRKDNAQARPAGGRRDRPVSVLRRGAERHGQCRLPANRSVAE
jgi:transposase-like protein